MNDITSLGINGISQVGSGGNVNLTNTGAMVLGGPIDLQTAGTTLTLAASGAVTQTASGIIEGSGNLTQAGLGQLLYLKRIPIQA